MKFYYDVGRAVNGPYAMLSGDALTTAGFEPGDRLEVNVEEGGHRLIITKAKPIFNAQKWARNIYAKYCDDYSLEEIGGLRCIAYEKVAPIGRMSKFGLAQCHPNDVYNPRIGRAVAICHAEGIPLPKEFTSSNVHNK